MSVGVLLIIVAGIVVVWPRVRLRHQLRSGDKAKKEQMISNDESHDSSSNIRL